MKIPELLQHIRIGGIDEKLRILYGSDETVLAAQRERYGKAVQRFADTFPKHDDVHIFSAPRRSEIGGNHTDHQHGCALAAAVNLDAVAVVAFHDEGVIRLMSEGYGLSEVRLSDLAVKDEEKGHSIAIVRGIAARFAQMGVKVGGFAGTIQAFVPLEKTEAYREKMDVLFGKGSCYVLRIRPVGGVKII